MSREILSVPEEHLQEVIDLILFAIEHYPHPDKISKDTHTSLYKWCVEEQEYLEKISNE